MEEDSVQPRQRHSSLPAPSLRRQERDWDVHSDPGQSSQSSKLTLAHGERTPPARAKTLGHLSLRPSKLDDAAPSAYRTSYTYTDGASFTTETQSYHSMHSKPSTEFGHIDPTLTVDHTGYMVPSEDTASEQLLNPYADPPLLKMALNAPGTLHYPMLGGPSRQSRQMNNNNNGFASLTMPEPTGQNTVSAAYPVLPSPSHDQTYRASIPTFHSDHDPTQMPVPIFVQRASPPNDVVAAKPHSNGHVPTLKGTRPISASSSPPSSPPTIPLPAIPSNTSSARNSGENARLSVTASPRTSTDRANNATHANRASSGSAASAFPSAVNDRRSRPSSPNHSSSGINTLGPRVPPTPTYPPPRPPKAATPASSSTPAISEQPSRPQAVPSASLAPRATESTAPHRAANESRQRESMTVEKLSDSRRRPGMPRQTESSLNTRYVNMLLAVDDIPQTHNILVGTFVWLLLAGFVLFPGTFTTLQERETAGIGGQVVGVVSQVPLYVIAWVCTAVGLAGMLFFWWRWRRNYIWLVNKIFMPGLLNSLAGLLSTIATVYGVHSGDLTATSESTLIVTGVSAGICLILVGIYQFGLLWRVKKEHDWTVGKGRAGEHGEGWIDTSKRKIKQAIV